MNSSNMALYRTLVKLGVADTEAEVAATFDTSLATKADLSELGLTMKAELAQVKADVSALRWMNGITWTFLVLVLGAVIQIMMRLPK